MRQQTSERKRAVGPNIYHGSRDHADNRLTLGPTHLDHGSRNEGSSPRLQNNDDDVVVVHATTDGPTRHSRHKAHHSDEHQSRRDDHFANILVDDHEAVP